MRQIEKLITFNKLHDLTPLLIYVQICKDKDEAEIWFVGLKALVTRGNNGRKWRFEPRPESLHSESPKSGTRKSTPSVAPFVCDNGFHLILFHTVQINY